MRAKWAKLMWAGYFLCFLLGLGAGGALFSRIVNDKLESFRLAGGVRRVNTVGFSTPSVVSASHFQPTVEFEQAAAASVNSVVFVSTRFSDSDSYLGLGDLFGSPQRGSGSGIILSEDGYIVTNNHVIEGASEILIVLNNKTEYEASVVGVDPDTDVAVLKIDAAGLPPVKFGNSDDARVGQWVLAVGNPFNLTSTVTAGIISAKARNIGILRAQSNGKNGQDYSIESFLQTDAAVNPGNSGGALVSLSGELMGVNTAIATETGSYSGYSFAIPSNLVKKVVNDLIRFGAVRRGFIGVNIQDVDAKTAQKNKLPTFEGAYVTGLAPNGGAKAAGLKSGDLITAIRGRKITSASELQEQIANYNPGDVVPIQVLRDEQVLTVDVTLRGVDGSENADAEKRSPRSEKSFVGGAARLLGATFAEPTPSELRRRDITQGVKVSEITKGGRFHNIGIEKGFIITAIDRKPVNSAQELLAMINDAENHVYIEGYKSNGKKSYYILRLD